MKTDEDANDDDVCVEPETQVIREAQERFVDPVTRFFQERVYARRGGSRCPFIRSIGLSARAISSSKSALKVSSRWKVVTWMPVHGPLLRHRDLGLDPNKDGVIQVSLAFAKGPC